MRAWGPFFLDRRAVLIVLATLVAVDAAVIHFHLLHVIAARAWPASIPASPFFGMHKEFGLCESLEYGKTLLCALCMAEVARRTRLAVYWLFAALFGWMTLDNAFALHEQFGDLFALNIVREAMFGFRDATGLGELVAFALVGGLAALAFFAMIIRTPKAWLPTVVLGGCAAVAPSVFGVGVDAFHASWGGLAWNEKWLVVLEDGGETLALSLNCALAVGSVCFKAAESPATTSPRTLPRQALADV